MRSGLNGHCILNSQTAFLILSLPKMYITIKSQLIDFTSFFELRSPQNTSFRKLFIYITYQSKAPTQSRIAVGQVV